MGRNPGSRSVCFRFAIARGILCTAYAPTNYYHGGEGDLYDVREDPRQWMNLWDDPGYRSVRDELLVKIREDFAGPRNPPLERCLRT